MVAKSFQTMTQIGEPYTKSNGRMYVKVKNEKTGTVREVRWYDEDEYAKLYPDEEPEKLSFKNQDKALGFQNGYITIFKGNTKEHQEWFEYSNARFCVHWGWYIVSTEEVPFDLPAGIDQVRLPWELVGNPTGELKSAVDVELAVGSLLYETHPSVFVGAVGERLDLNITVIHYELKDNFFGGKSATHIFEDECGNHYMWITGSQFWNEGQIKHIRGTVKEHKVVNNIRTTVLTRCAEVK